MIVAQKTTATIPASGVGYSPPMKLSSKYGFFSVQTVVSGSGTLAITYQMSNSEAEPLVWSSPAEAEAIASGLTAGTTMYKFEPVTIGMWLRLVFTETGTSNTVTYACSMAAQ